MWLLSLLDGSSLMIVSELDTLGAQGPTIPCGKDTHVYNSSDQVRYGVTQLPCSGLREPDTP